MDTKIYYNPKEQGILITSNFEEKQKKMNLGIHPRINYEEISTSDLDKYKFDGISFDKIDNLYFQSIKEIFSKYEFKGVAFHQTNVDLSEIVISTKHLVIGENNKINITLDNLENLNEVTLLSVKTFKGRILGKAESVEKLILWSENKKSNEILPMFPNLKEFFIYNGSIVELNLMENPLLERLQLHRCVKMEKVVLNPSIQLKKVVVEACKKLDVSNLGDNVVRI